MILNKVCLINARREFKIHPARHEPINVLIEKLTLERSQFYDTLRRITIDLLAKTTLFFEHCYLFKPNVAEAIISIIHLYNQ